MSAAVAAPRLTRKLQCSSDLRIADDEAAAARRIDQLPGFATGRVLEGRAAGACVDRLARLARRRDRVHFGADSAGSPGLPCKTALGEDHVVATPLWR